MNMVKKVKKSNKYIKQLKLQNEQIKKQIKEIKLQNEQIKKQMKELKLQNKQIRYYKKGHYYKGRVNQKNIKSHMNYWKKFNSYYYGIIIPLNNKNLDYEKKANVLMKKIINKIDLSIFRSMAKHELALGNTNKKNIYITDIHGHIYPLNSKRINLSQEAKKKHRKAVKKMNEKHSKQYKIYIGKIKKVRKVKKNGKRRNK
jgi:hypothetical protein